MNLDERAVLRLMFNVRLLLNKKQNKKLVNWVLYKEIFAVGSTSAKQACKDLDIYPDGTESIAKKYLYWRVKDKIGGGSFIDTRDQVDAFLLYDGPAEDYEITEVRLTKLQFESLPEFEGF